MHSKFDMRSFEGGGGGCRYPGRDWPFYTLKPLHPQPETLNPALGVAAEGRAQLGSVMEVSFRTLHEVLNS